MRKKIIIIILIIIIVILGIIYNTFGHKYAMVGVLDKTTKNYIHDPQITMFPSLSLEGQPGTDATGPYLYRSIIPMPVIVTVNASGYKSEKKILFLVKGKESVIYLTSE